jgi:hypothetical protein
MSRDSVLAEPLDHFYQFFKHSEQFSRWASSSGEDTVYFVRMPRQFFAPTHSQQNVVLVDRRNAWSPVAKPVVRMQKKRSGSPDGFDPSMTDYVLEVSARCLQCLRGH